MSVMDAEHVTRDTAARWLSEHGAFAPPAADLLVDFGKVRDVYEWSIGSHRECRLAGGRPCPYARRLRRAVEVLTGEVPL